MLTGHEVLMRALGAAGIRCAWSAAGPSGPLGPLESLLQRTGASPPTRHQFAVNEQVAISLALGSALLSGQGSAALLRQIGVGAALEALSTFGLTNEFRAAALIVEGADPGPTHAHGACDPRAALARQAQLAQLEAAAPDEIYHFTRLAAQASRRAGMPIAIRVGRRALEARVEALAESAPDAPDETFRFSRIGGPYVCAASTYRFHAEKRARRVAQLAPLVETLTVEVGSEGAKAVVISGQLGGSAQARAWARRLPSLRLPCAWPLPRLGLGDFLRGRAEVLVLEEGEPFIEEAIQAFAQRERIPCRIYGAGEPRPQRLDSDRLEAVLERFGGPVRGEVEPIVRAAEVWRAAAERVVEIREDDGEPWPLHFGRTRGEMVALPVSDPRRTLLEHLRKLPRPTLVAADPGPGMIGSGGARDRLIDLMGHTGAAPALAGGLAGAAEIEEAAGAPLAVALVGDTDFYHSGLAGMIDNALAGRDVLHVLVMRREQQEMWPGPPQLGAPALEGLLRAAGLELSTCGLTDAALSDRLTSLAAQTGPRALVCYHDLPES